MTFKAVLNDSETARAIYDVLPLKQPVHRWGDEIYFDIPINVKSSSDASAEVEEGDLAYWHVNPAFCIFFGRTPVSTSDKPRALSHVNVFGKITGDLSGLKKVKDRDIITVEMC